MSFNKVILIGNLTADPELKQTQNGISVTSFSIAVSRRFSSKNTENAQQADFIIRVRACQARFGYRTAGFCAGALYKKEKLLSQTGIPKSVTIHNTNDLFGVDDDGEQYVMKDYHNALRMISSQVKQFGGIDMIQYDLEMRKTIEKLKELNK